jgi:hypothetical protein
MNAAIDDAHGGVLLAQALPSLVFWARLPLLGMT